MSERSKNNKDYNEKSTLAVLGEILKLLCLLLWKGIKILGRFLLKCLKFILKCIVKGLVFVIDFIDSSIDKLKKFWNDNSTQDKRHKIVEGLKHAGLACLKGIAVAFLFIGKSLLWLLKKSVLGLIHLKSTFRAFWKWIKKTSVRFVNWIKKQGRNFKSWTSNLRRNYRSFRHNQGFKGLLVDLRNGLKSGITDFVEKEIDEDNEESEDNVDIEIDTEINEDDDDNPGVLKKIGRKIYRSMKNIVDVD